MVLPVWRNLMNQRLEVYVESYNSEPIVHEVSRTLTISIGDEISRDDWLNLLRVPNAVLELKVKVEDIQHLFWDSEDLQHSINIRVVPVD